MLMLIGMAKSDIIYDDPARRRQVWPM